MLPRSFAGGRYKAKAALCASAPFTAHTSMEKAPIAGAFSFGDDMANDPWNSAAGRAVRAECWRRDSEEKAPCHICHGDIDYSVPPSSTSYSWEPDHRISRSKHPEYTLAMWNILPSHRRCNRAKRDRAGISELGTLSEAFDTL